MFLVADYLKKVLGVFFYLSLSDSASGAEPRTQGSQTVVFQQLSFSILCLQLALLWRSTVAFTYLKVKSAK